LLVIWAIGMIFGKGKETLEGILGVFYIIFSITLSILFNALPIVVAILVVAWIFS
jgi:hypothetical protein